MKKKFKNTICNCGCNKTFKRWLNPTEVPDYKITNYKTYSKEPLSIKRLSDNVEFTLGDTLLLKSADGKVKRKVKLYHIQVEESGFMQMHAYSLNTRGSYSIRNKKMYLNNATDPTNFMFTMNITKL